MTATTKAIMKVPMLKIDYYMEIFIAGCGI